MTGKRGRPALLPTSLWAGQWQAAPGLVRMCAMVKELEWKTKELEATLPRGAKEQAVRWIKSRWEVSYDTVYRQSRMWTAYERETGGWLIAWYFGPQD